MGSDTALTAFQYHGTTEEDTKDDGSVLMSPLAAQYGPEETQDQVLCSMDLTRSFGLRPALFSMNFNTSLAIQTQLKPTFTNSAFHMRTRRGNGPSSLQCTVSLLFFHPGGRSHLRTALQMHSPQNGPQSGKPQCCRATSCQPEMLITKERN